MKTSSVSPSRIIDSTNSAITTNPVIGTNKAVRPCSNVVESSDLDGLALYLKQPSNKTTSIEGPVTYCFDQNGSNTQGPLFDIRIETEYPDERGIKGYTLDSRYQFAVNTDPNQTELYYFDDVGVITVKGRIQSDGLIHAELRFANLPRTADHTLTAIADVYEQCRENTSGHAQYENDDAVGVVLTRNCVQDYNFSPLLFLETQPTLYTSNGTPYINWANVRNHHFYKSATQVENLKTVATQLSENQFPTDFNNLKIKTGYIGVIKFAPINN